MKRCLQFALVLLLPIAGLAQPQVVDRMVAVVNKRVILQSELDQAARVEFLLQGKPIASLTQADTAAVLEQLIDRSLLDQQIVNPAMLDPSLEEIAAKVREVRQNFPGSVGRDDDRWKSTLTTYGLTAQDLEEQLSSQARILRFVDLRFHALVRVEKDDIETYYQEKFLPEVRKRNATAPALADVSDKIEQILVEQRIDNLLSDWLKTLRAQAHIETMLPAPSAPAAGTAP
ncbi:MAG TPA: SurA N-terminal domain-containing protein [Candidatus Angelobacter sp.]|nr:SurA N-terminal domain-containing protein [Candidatus Angelobacter sp.]